MQDVCCHAGGRYDKLMKATWHPTAGPAPAAAGITIAAQALMACVAEPRPRPSSSLHQSQACLQLACRLQLACGQPDTVSLFMVSACLCGASIVLYKQLLDHKQAQGSAPDLSWLMPPRQLALCCTA